MAEPATSDSSPDTDRDFDPSADMMVHDFDNEATIDEEEAMSGESCSNELDDLEKEGEMPLDELLAMYGYGHEGGAPPPSVLEPQDTRSSSEEEILSNQDLTLDKEEVARDLLLTDDGNNKETSVNELLDSVDMPSQTVRLLRSSSRNGSSEDEDSPDEDYVPNDDWKKTISVGGDFQAVIPQGLYKYGDAPAYENEDRLLWDPHKIHDKEVEKYLGEVHRQNCSSAQGVQAVPTGSHTRDDEQALYLLLQCGHNVEEAVRRRKMQAVPPTDPMSLWSEEECRNFENGLRLYGKDFYSIQQNKVRTRSVGELVQFYYLWKKTERHDMFANKNRLEKKKYVLHPGVTDYMDRFLDEQENPSQLAPRERSASPITSLLYGDSKRHSVDLKENSADLQAALEMVQKVVDPEKVFGEMNPELNTATTTTVSISPSHRGNQQSPENVVHIANFSSARIPASPSSATARGASSPSSSSTVGRLNTPPTPSSQTPSTQTEETANGYEPNAKRFKSDLSNCITQSSSSSLSSSSTATTATTSLSSSSSPSSSVSSASIVTSTLSHSDQQQPVSEASAASEKSATPAPAKGHHMNSESGSANHHINNLGTMELSIASLNTVHSIGERRLATPIPAEAATAESIAQ